MIKNLVRLTSKVNNRDVELTCDNDCPLEVVKEALFQFQNYVGKIEEQIRAAQEKAKAEEQEKALEAPVEEPQAA